MSATHSNQKGWHLLIYLILLQFSIPIPTLLWGELAGVLAGALIAAVLTPLVVLALSRVLRRVKQEVNRLSFSAQSAPAAELWWLPLLKTVGLCLTRSLGPVSVLLLLVCLSGILPGLFYMLLVFFDLLYILTILAVIALVALGKAHPELLQILMSSFFRRRQHSTTATETVIIVPAAAEEQTTQVRSFDGLQPAPFQLHPWSDTFSGGGRLQAAITLLLLTTHARSTDRSEQSETQEQERD